MDHSDKIKQNLGILGLDSLEGLSLPQLQDAITKNLPAEVSEKQILNIYVMWLHERLMAVDISDQDAVTDEITSWHRFLKELSNDDCDITEAFHDWQHAQIIGDPASSRRLSIAEAELRHQISTVRPSQAGNSQVAVGPDGCYGQMHPDRLKLSQATQAVELDGDEPEGIVISPDRSPKHHGQSGSAAQVGKSDLSFLTGANRLAMDDDADFIPDKQPVDAAFVNTKSVPAPLASREVTPRRDTTPYSKSPPGYVCARCGIPGHLLKECPTNMDPAFDRRPPESYICKICKKAGDHFIQLCPKHPDPASLGRKRRKAMRANDRTGEDRRRQVYDDDFWDNRASRSQGTSLWYNDLRRRSRSPSPVRRDGWHERRSPKRRHRDHLDLRGSMSPPPPRPHALKKRPHRNELPRKKTPKKVVFADDLVKEMKPRDEGRLSYWDDCDGEAPSKSLTRLRISRPWEGEEMDVDMPDVPVTKTGTGLDSCEAQRFEGALLEMIRAESTKTDLLLLIDGVEYSRPYSASVAKLLQNHKHIWVHEAFKNKKTRPGLRDFLGSDTKSESDNDEDENEENKNGQEIVTEGMEWEATAEKQGAEEEMVDLAMDVEPADSTCM